MWTDSGVSDAGRVVTWRVCCTKIKIKISTDSYIVRDFVHAIFCDVCLESPAKVAWLSNVQYNRNPSNVSPTTKTSLSCGGADRTVLLAGARWWIPLQGWLLPILSFPKCYGRDLE